MGTQRRPDAFWLDIDDLKRRAAKHANVLMQGGHDPNWTDNPHLVLTTIGRKSRALRSTPLICGRDGDRYIVVASLGGYSRHPQWYLNLVADPTVVVHSDGKRYEARAIVAEGAERMRLWDLMVAVYGRYAEYQKLTDRQIPVVILEPLS